MKTSHCSRLLLTEFETVQTLNVTNLMRTLKGTYRGIFSNSRYNGVDCNALATESSL